MELEEISGNFRGTGRRFTIVASRFNSRLVNRLIAGAVDCLRRHGVADDDLRVVRVPGAWEIPTALRAAAEDEGVDGLVALGVVIRGETAHFDYISTAASHGIAKVSEETRLPVGFGLLTCETSLQAEERCGGKGGNKGIEAALAALEMADLLRRLKSSG